MAPRTIAIVAVAGVFAAGCSGGDDSSSAASEDAPELMTPATSIPATTAPATTAPATTAPPTTMPVTTVDDVAEWCDVARDVESLSAEGDTVDFTDPPAVESFLGRLVPAFEEAAAVAPDAIADDVRTSAELAADLRDALAETDYDMLTADLSIIDERSDEQDAATTAIEEFNAEHCGIPIDDTGDDTGDGSDDDVSFAAGSLRDQFIRQLVDTGFTLQEAACIFGELDFSATDSFDDPAVLGPVFETCGIGVDRLEEIGTSAATSPTTDDLLTAGLSAAGLEDEQIACVTDALGATPPEELSESAIVEVMLDCGVGLDQLTGVDPGTAGDVEQAFIDEFVAMGFSEDDASCLYDELFVGNIDGVDDTDIAAAFAACDLDQDQLG
jgi:hypothetical protein